jgi:sarcosine oxidase subunit gamma
VGWLGPDEWLVLSPYEEVDTLQGTLANGLAHLHHAVTDISDQYAMMNLAGSASREVLASGCPLDFHSTVFKTGMCAQSHFLRTGIMVWQLDGAPRYEILVQRSAADYLWRALAASIAALP